LAGKSAVTDAAATTGKVAAGEFAGAGTTALALAVASETLAAFRSVSLCGGGPACEVPLSPPASASFTIGGAAP
jgi:hypothetical protein